MARIILKTADFSANNIGRDVILSDFTKKVLAKQSQYDVGSDEAVALDTFLNHLIEDGFIGGESPLLKTLIIPGLAANHNQLLYDIAYIDGNGYPTNVMSQGETEATEANRVYRPVLDANNRIVAVQRYATVEMDATTAKAQANIDNRAFRLLNVGVANNGQQNPFSIVIYIHNAVNDTYWQNPSGSFYLSRTQIADYNVLSESFTTMVKFGIFNYNKTNTRFEGTVDGTSFEGTSGSPVLYKTSDAWSTTWIGPFSYSNKPEISLFAMGDYIPSEKHSALKGYVETFLAAIHANI